jgi:hypothetical protein
MVKLFTVKDCPAVKLVLFTVISVPLVPTVP